jgi:hypothetical protein
MLQKLNRGAGQFLNIKNKILLFPQKSLQFFSIRIILCTVVLVFYSQITNMAAEISNSRILEKQEL